MTSRLMAVFAAVTLFGCSGTQNSESSDTSALGATAAVESAAVRVTVPHRHSCGPTASPGDTSASAVVACPADEQCCNGFCVGDNVLCVAPPPPTCGVDSTGAAATCGDGLVCCDGKCAPGCTDPPPPVTCNPASASPESQCPAEESCCNGKCQPSGEACAAPQCNAAADCTGGLPQVCEICSNGQSECAHFECIAGSCQIVICDPGPSTGTPNP